VSENRGQAAGGGLGFTGALTIALIVLKLTHTIAWPWVWVISPMWISAAITVAIVILVALGAIIYSYVEDRWRR